MLTKRILLGLTGLVAAGLIGVATIPPMAQADADSLMAGTVPVTLADPDVNSVELGVQFIPRVDGTITAIRFYKSAANAGPHVGSLWTGDGQKLASVQFKSQGLDGWQEAKLSSPVAVRKGATYVASYVAPTGRYSADEHGFDRSMSNGDLTVPAGGGVYRYGTGGFPTGNWKNSNYYIDVVFRAADDSGSADPTGSPSAPTTEPSPTPSTTPSSTPSSTPSTTPTSPPTTAPTGSQDDATLDLPRIPWEGADYWAQFPKAKAAGWADPNFFPIAVWWAVANTPAEVAADRSMGINTYVLTNEQSDYRVLENGGMYYVGSQLPHSTAASRNWVGSFLDDEVDGRFTSKEGFSLLQRLSDNADPAKTGRFRYANFTSSLVTYDRPVAERNQYVNGYTDLVSLDQYFYGLEGCDWGANALRWPALAGVSPVNPSNCRTSSSYGKMVDLMRQADAADGHLQAIWNFVEVVGEPNKLDYDKVQGAAMNSVIHGARGVIWFPQAFEGDCGTGNAFRTYQQRKSACLAKQVQGAAKVNSVLASMAPVLNTQSYKWSFGSGIDSMLKTHDGSAYIFAMTKDGGTGERTFKLPAGVNGSTVEVVGENRTIDVQGGSFRDTFAKESSYHIYKIAQG